MEKRQPTTNLLLDDGNFIVDSLEDEVGYHLDVAGTGGVLQLAQLLKLLDGGDLVVLCRDVVHHLRPSAGLHHPRNNTSKFPEAALALIAGPG